MIATHTMTLWGQRFFGLLLVLAALLKIAAPGPTVGLLQQALTTDGAVRGAFLLVVVIECAIGGLLLTEPPTAGRGVAISGALTGIVLVTAVEMLLGSGEAQLGPAAAAAPPGLMIAGTWLGTMSCALRAVMPRGTAGGRGATRSRLSSVLARRFVLAGFVAVIFVAAFQRVAFATGAALTGTTLVTHNED